MIAANDNPALYLEGKGDGRGIVLGIMLSGILWIIIAALISGWLV